MHVLSLVTAREASIADGAIFRVTVDGRVVNYMSDECIVLAAESRRGDCSVINKLERGLLLLRTRSSCREIFF